MLPPPPPELTLDESEVLRPASPPPLPLPRRRSRRRASRTALPHGGAHHPAHARRGTGCPRLDDPSARRLRCSLHHLAAASASMPPPAASPAASAAAPKGTELDMRYQKFDPIGSGPLGTVFKGRFNALGLDICHQGAEGHLRLLLLPAARRGAQAAEEGAVRAGAGAPPGHRADHRSERGLGAALLRGGAAARQPQGEAGRGRWQGRAGAAWRCAASCSWPTACARRTPRGSRTTTSSRRTSSSTATATRSWRTSASGASSRWMPPRACPRSSWAPGGMVYMAPELINRSKDVGAVGGRVRPGHPPLRDAHRADPRPPLAAALRGEHRRARPGWTPSSTR